jgi:hypothetical protein
MEQLETSSARNVAALDSMCQFGTTLPESKTSHTRCPATGAPAHRLIAPLVRSLHLNVAELIQPQLLLGNYL